MKTITIERTILAAIAALFLVLPATATAGDLVGELRFVSSYATDDSVDALTEEDQFSNVRVGIGWGVEEILPGLRGYVTYTGGGLTNTRLGGTVTWDWRRDIFMAEAEWGPTFFEFLRPWGRLGVGYAVQGLEFDTAASPTLHDYAHDLAVRPSIGFDVFLPLRWSARAVPFTVGLSTEFGYLWMTSANFDELRYEDDAFGPEDEDPFARETPELGELDTNGLYWNLGLQARLRF